MLRELLHLNEETGKLYWKVAPSINKKHLKGKEAFKNKSNKGYYRQTIKDITFKKEIVVFAILHGKFPSGLIIHADGNKENFAAKNIVDAHVSLVRHMKKSKPSKTGYIGVRLALAPWTDTPFCSLISENGKMVSNGMHKTAIEAARAYDKAAFEKWGEHARLNFPEEYGLASKEFTEMPEGYYDETE